MLGTSYSSLLLPLLAWSMCLRTCPRLCLLGITFEGQFNKVNKVLSFDTSTSVSEITSLEILSKSLQLNIGFCLWTPLQTHLYLQIGQSIFWEVISLKVSSKKNDVVNCTYSDVPLLAKVNQFIRRSELTCSPATYIIYLISLVT